MDCLYHLGINQQRERLVSFKKCKMQFQRSHKENFSYPNEELSVSRILVSWSIAQMSQKTRTERRKMMFYEDTIPTTSLLLYSCIGGMDIAPSSLLTLHHKLFSNFRFLGRSRSMRKNWTKAAELSKNETRDSFWSF